jgi:Concanavalin A-like lectin/glucanases superfamily/FecR protein
MTDIDPNRDGIDKALARFLDGEPEPEDGELLTQAMRADDRFAREVVRLLVVDDLLRQDALSDDAAFIDSLKIRLDATPSEDEVLRRFMGLDARAEVSETPRPRIRRRPVAGLMALAAVVALIACFGRWRGTPRLTRSDTVAGSKEERAAANPAEMVVAVLTRVVDSRWAEAPGIPTEEGSALPACRLRLASGLVQIEFVSGVSVIIEGPCDFELLSPVRAICHRGKVRAHVPPQARGFTIAAPGLDAVDLGTEFAVRVGEGGQGEVHVMEGAVDLHGTGDRAATRKITTLTTGRGVHFGPDGALREIAAAPADFVDRSTVLAREEIHHRDRHRLWLAHSQALRADPDMVLYYTFEERSTWQRTLRNVARSTGPSLDGAVVGCLWSQGRWPGKDALEFKRTSDRVRIDVPGEFAELTLAAWVRIEGLNTWLSSLMLTDDWEPRSAHWQINAKGEIILGVLMSEDRGSDSGHRSPPVLGPGDLGRWVHLATVYDSRRNLIVHYLDGRAISHGSLPDPIPLRIGHADIGNWNVSRAYFPDKIRSLNGRIDEFAILRRALSEEEILRMYELGKPNS